MRSIGQRASEKEYAPRSGSIMRAVGAHRIQGILGH